MARRRPAIVNAVRAARLRAGFTPQQMAGAMQISVRTLRDQENLPTPRHLYALAAEHVAWRRENIDLQATKARDDRMRALLITISDAAAKGLGL